MGAGGDYWIEFDRWFGRKHAEAKAAFVEEHPEPAGWDGFYRRKGVRT